MGGLRHGWEAFRAVVAAGRQTIPRAAFRYWGGVNWNLIGPLIPTPVWFSRLWRARGLDSAEDGVRWSSVTPSDWEDLGRGPMLLMIHGTGLRTVAGFVGLTREEFTRLEERYEGRILAWEHCALAHHLDRNARELARALERGGRPLTIDVLALSRGGLVARRLVEGWEQLASDICIRKLVMVGTPNDGTPSARRDGMGDGNVEMKAWRTDVRRLALTDERDREVRFHDDPFSIPGFDPGERQMGVWPLLHGSQDQVPGSPCLQQLNGFAGPAPHPVRPTTYYALASIFTFDHGAPEAQLLPHLDRRGVCAHAIPDVPNDLVVPTASVIQPSQGPDASGHFPLGQERVAVLRPCANATHVGLFRLDAVRRKCMEWLAEPQPENGVVA